MKKGLFVRKPVNAQQEEEGQHSLRRHLTMWHLVAIGIGGIIGAGIFVVTGQAASQMAGPAICFSFIIGAMICCLAGLCYAELSSMIPVSGGAYSYTYASMGEFAAWLIGWAITAQYLIAAATVAVGWSGYFVSFLGDFGLQLSSIWTKAPLVYVAGQGWQLSGAVLNFPAAIILGLIGSMICIGIRAATQFNNVMVFIKLVTIALFIILGCYYVKADNWSPFIPENTGVFGEFGASGVFRAAGFLFLAYIGFDTVSTLAQEAVNPQKDIPRGILGSLLFSTLAYIVIALVLTGMVNYRLLNVPDPMSLALDVMGPSMVWFRFVMKVSILAALSSVILVHLLGMTRVMLAMGKDGLLPKSFASIHKTLRTPIVVTVVATLFTMMLSGLFSVEILGSIASMATLFIFGVVCLGVLILRYTHPEFERSFKVPLVPWVPLAGVFCCIGQMFFFPLTVWIQMLMWFGVGILIYFGYGIRHSKIRRG